MTVQIRTPVPLEDTLALYQQAVTNPFALKAMMLRAVVLQGVRSDTIGFYDGKRLIAAAMLYPCAPERPGEDLRELAFLCLPEAARHMLAIVRAARLTAAHLAHDPAIRIRATVRSDAGRRLALLCGLRPIQGSSEVLEWQKSQSRRSSPPPAARAARCSPRR